MATITISKKVFESLVGKKLPFTELEERISLFGTPFENLNGDELSIEVFPNRPDILSVQGYARAFSAFIGHKKGLRKYDIKKLGEKVIIDSSVNSVRPFTACAIVKGLKFGDEKIKEVIDIQEKLHLTFGRNRKKLAIGIYPYEKIKTPITFFAADPKTVKFRPLEFPKEITGLQILSQHPTGREYAYLLEGQKKFPFFKDVNGKILSMPPIINSHETGKIAGKTKDVFIECSGFDFKVLNKCLNIIVTALADMGGQIYSMELNYGKKKYVTPNLTPERMKLNIKYVNKILGLNLKENEIKNYLERMGYSYSKGTVLIPAYRTDILHEIDLVEDIGIAHGYEKLKEEIPKVATIAEENKFEIFKNKIAEILIGLGLTEVNTYHLVPSTINKKINLNENNVKLENSKSEEYNSLRSYLSPSLLSVLENNKNREYPQNIFEMGLVVKKDFEEKTKLCILLCDNKTNFTSIKQILDQLCAMLNVTYNLEETELNAFILGRAGKIIINKEKIGSIGEISPLVLTNFGLEIPVSALELDLNALIRMIK
ncbi:MAG: phenylalanine--tRNA ligase subunit beta [Candidatus Nanoarchaeia archaeon]|nr:phenylalanine--tRNA ligase subunit beta [Candidatus Nanoarchaeia archaeon]MDD5588155.1 phenylalanine--tRNA ligase subunit beta [Candidatus Nanoarchaeia archaeon]